MAPLGPLPPCPRPATGGDVCSGRGVCLAVGTCNCTNGTCGAACEYAGATCASLPCPAGTYGHAPMK